MAPLSIFVSYAHEDESFCQELKKHFAPLEKQSLIECWYDRAILAGYSWEKEIRSRLDNADVILLLVSANFLSSEFCQTEMEQALERPVPETRVVPVILRPCLWERTRLSQ